MKLSYIPILAILALIVFISGCTSSGGNTNNQQTGPVNCTDPTCLYPQFMACNSSELRMPFMEGTTYVFTVFGMENGKCHFAVKVVNASGVVPLEMQVTDCSIPTDKITTDTFTHYFGQDSGPGKEAIKAQQDQIQTDYCTMQ